MPESWQQGRTAYGGLSAAIALAGVRAALPDAPPLRAAQIAFVGPLAGRVEVRARVLRQGRSVTFAVAELHGEAGVGLTATFVLAAARASSLAHDAPDETADPPEIAPPSVLKPPFAANFDYRLAGPLVRGTPDLVQWVRLREAEGLDAELHLLAIGDALPPAALLLMRERMPLSSVNWSIDLVRSPPVTRDGWWLLRSTAHQAGDGYSAQAMTIRDADGALVAVGSQTVALFG